MSVTFVEDVPLPVENWIADPALIGIIRERKQTKEDPLCRIIRER